MIKTWIAVIFAVLAMAPLRAGDMQEYLSRTVELVREGEHEEALERFVWFHHHVLEHERAMYGVRLSFALGYWRQLGEVYPPALEAMKEIRVENTEQIKSGDGDFYLFHDVVALNQTLGENDATVALFEFLHKKRPDEAARYWGVADDAVLEAERYDLARHYMDDTAEAFERVVLAYEVNKDLYDKTQERKSRFRAYNESKLVKESLKLIELALAFGDEKAANAIRDRALELVDDDRLRDAIPDDTTAPSYGRGDDSDG